ncbi:uncharacterized protein J3R85_005374 [Psidium guajava]|nr:uncharacterized protein J3R85_005374 [Psidium guajava]
MEDWPSASVGIHGDSKRVNCSIFQLGLAFGRVVRKLD